MPVCRGKVLQVEDQRLHFLAVCRVLLCPFFTCRACATEEGLGFTEARGGESCTFSAVLPVRPHNYGLLVSSLSFSV